MGYLLTTVALLCVACSPTKARADILELVQQEPRVFVCENSWIAVAMIMNGFSTDPLENRDCTMVPGVGIASVGVMIGDTLPAIQGEGYAVGVNLYEVKVGSCGQPLVMAYPYYPDPHYTNPQLAADGGLPLIAYGFPAEVCTNGTS